MRCEGYRAMNLRSRAGLVLIVGLVLCLVLLGREILRPDAAEPDSSEKVAVLAESPVVAPPATIAQPAPAVIPAADVSSPGGTLRGHVIDAVTREAVREFEVEFHQPGGRSTGVRTFRAEDGRFEWSGIPPRAWIITVSARGYQRFDMNQVLIEAGTAREFVIPLRRGLMLRGRVYDERSGKGIPAASVSFREATVGRFDDDFRIRLSANTGKDGSFVLDGVPAGSITLSVSAPKYSAREIDVVIDKRTQPVQIALSTGGAITGYLATADGAPVAGIAGVTHLDEGHGYGSRTTDAGEFSFEHLAPGRYRIVGQSRGLRTEQDLVLGKDERKEGLVLTLDAGRNVRGVVTGLNPADLAQVSVRVQYAGVFSDAHNVRVDAGGAYEIQGVAPGPMTVIADLNQRRQVKKEVQMPPDADIAVNLEFSRGSRLTGNVTRGGMPMANVWIHPMPVNEETSVVYGVQTSGKGEYAIEDVPDGEYFIRVGSYRSRRFRVNGDTVFDIDEPIAKLSGRVIEEGGTAPVAEAHVYLSPLQAEAAQPHRNSASNSFGEFKIAAMESGDYLLSAYKPGYEMYRERISYGPASGGITIPLRQGKGVEVRLREAGSGSPIREAHVSETIDGRRGIGMPLRLDQNGVGYLPRALTGSTLTFYVESYANAMISNWDGQELDVQMKQERAP
jgi:hypothetical protein